MSGDTGEDAISPPPARYEEPRAARGGVGAVAASVVALAAGIGWASLAVLTTGLFARGADLGPTTAVAVAACVGVAGAGFLILTTTSYPPQERIPLLLGYVVSGVAAIALLRSF